MNELELQTLPPEIGLTVYAVISVGGMFLKGTIPEAYNPAHQADYAVAMTEQGAAGFYRGNFPTGVTTSAVYDVTIFKRESGTPSANDSVLGFGEIVWPLQSEATGASLVSLPYIKRHYPQLANVGDDLLNEYIAAAASAVKRYCRQEFVPTAYTEYYDLDQYSHILLLNHYPVMGVSQVTTNPNSNQSEVNAGSLYAVSRDGRLARKEYALDGYCGAYFSGGFQSVQVKYTAGYSVIPADVRKAVAMIVKRMYDGRSISGAYESERLGDYNYKLRADAHSLIGNDVKELLNEYRPKGL